jgi:predicted transcriptional regulator
MPDDEVMAVDGLKVELDSELAGRVKVFAAATGANVETVVGEAVDAYVNDWSETLERLAEFDRTAERLDAETVLTEFRSAVAARSSGSD